MTRGYELNLEKICHNQRFGVSQVVSSELVFPKGAVPNAQLLWVKVELTSGERIFVTLPLRDFYEYVDLPLSSIGGWTDGDRGSDYAGLDPRYVADDTGSGEPIRRELLISPEGIAEPMDAQLHQQGEG